MRAAITSVRPSIRTENQLTSCGNVAARDDGGGVRDRGVSGSKDKRPALDELVKSAKRRKFDVLVCGG
jgi:DNA invertase Pin-like site-specific DNA recombinase